jgi:hypothetical protein
MLTRAGHARAERAYPAPIGASPPPRGPAARDCPGRDVAAPTATHSAARVGGSASAHVPFSAAVLAPSEWVRGAHGSSHHRLKKRRVPLPDR